jgi:hypothetical protein
LIVEPQTTTLVSAGFDLWLPASGVTGAGSGRGRILHGRPAIARWGGHRGGGGFGDPRLRGRQAEADDPTDGLIWAEAAVEVYSLNLEA